MDRAQELIDAGRASRKEGRLEEARTLYLGASEVLRTADAPLRLAHALRHVADIERHLQSFAAAELNYAEALAIYRSQLDTGVLDLANTLRPYAFLREAAGERELARAMLTEARNLYASLNLQAGVDEAESRLHKL